MPCGGHEKSPSISSVIFYFFWDHRAYPAYFEKKKTNRIPFKPELGGVYSLANSSVVYEETQSNRVSDFRDFVCSLFPKAILFDFYSFHYLTRITPFHYPSRKLNFTTCLRLQTAK